MENRAVHGVIVLITVIKRTLDNVHIIEVPFIITRLRLRIYEEGGVTHK